jgi:acrylyl-CoA reductase (NADPH)
MATVRAFRALVVDECAGAVSAALRDVERAALPAGDVVVAVAYSSLNYKDGLAVTGQGKVVRHYPMIPGIDLAGTVEQSTDPRLAPGDQVVLTGWGLGESQWGGYAQLARMPGEWLLPLPEGFTLQRAMGIGTAGLTAMLAVMALEERGLRPERGKVVVTGAAGGVGSLSVALLAARGYHVVASTGRPEAHGYLKELGAQSLLDRTVLAAPGAKPLEPARWAGAVDTVGGETLAGLLRTVGHGAGIAVCGLAGGSDLHATVYPFILRGAALLGIASATCPPERRRLAWAALARDLPASTLDSMVQVAPLADVPALSREILAGRIRGRVVVDVNR